MKHLYARVPKALPSMLLSLGLAGSLTVALAQDVAAPAAGRTAQPASGAQLLGGALPGGAIISAKSVLLAPVSGGDGHAVPIAADGSFRAEGLEPGRYRLALSTVTVPKQTQGATFGEKVNAGLHAAGSAVAQGAGMSRHDIAKNSVGNIRARDSNMPNRISMNVTTPKQAFVLDVDGAPVEVEIDATGSLAGRTSAR